MPKKQTYQQALAKLERIVEKLEDPQTPIEESLSLYKEGVDLAKFCSDTLDNVEGELTVLRQQADGVFKREPWSEE